MSSIGLNYDITAEQSILGAILLDPNILDEITFLEPRDFSSDRHRKIYEVMRYLEQNNNPVDLVTVASEYMKFGRIEDMGNASYLTDLANSVPTTANIDYYANIVRSKALRRRGTEIGHKIAELAYDDFETDDDYFVAVEALAANIRPQKISKMMSFSESKENYLEHLTKEAEYIKTGFMQYDTWSRGLWRGWLFISAGRPSVGKTALVLQRLYGIAKQNEGVVLLYSQEMDSNQIKDRMISATTGIHYSKIKDKKLTANEFGVVTAMYEKLEKLPIFIQDSSGITIEEIKATAKIFKKKYGRIAVIAVDYLQIMNIPQKKGETRAQAIGTVTRSAKSIARDMNCCFMMLSQMTRESEQKKKPQLSDLKESSAIEQDADVVEFLWHDPKDTDREGKVIQQFIAKGRDIGIKEFRLAFKGWQQRFIELPSK